MIDNLHPDRFFTFTHDTCMVEFDPGEWTPVCVQCGPLLDARSEQRDGKIMLEEHERHVPHRRGLDRPYARVEPHLYRHCRA